MTSTRQGTTDASPGAARMLYGAAVNVRALRSRELTQILIEAPDDFHVSMTNLLHGQDVLVLASHLPLTQPYGLISIDGASGETVGGDESNPAIEGNVGFVHGRVSLVKAAPSRGVSVVCVELPESCHVEVTKRFFGAGVLLLPCRLPAGTPYGILPREDGPADASRKPADAPARSGASARSDRPAAGHAPVRRLGLQGPANNEATAERWLKRLAIMCKEAAFQEWLGASSEMTARDELLRRVGAESRREIAGDAGLRQRFDLLVGDPYEAHKSTQHRTPFRAPAQASTTPAKHQADAHPKTGHRTVVDLASPRTTQPDTRRAAPMLDSDTQSQSDQHHRRERP